MRRLCAMLLFLVPVPALAQEARVLTGLGLEPVAWSRWEARVPDIQRWLAQARIPIDSGTAVAREASGGNVIATFALGTMAVAVAQQRVGPRAWYLVVTDEGSVQTSVPNGARGPGRWTTSPPLRLRDRFAGWMSSRWREVLTDSLAPLPWPSGPPPLR